MKSIKISYSGLIFLSILLTNVGLLFNYKLTGRFELSNLFQVFSLIVMLPNILHSFRKKHYVFFLTYLACGFLAAYFIQNIYNFTFRIPHFTFFSIAILQMLCLHIETKKYDLKDKIAKAYRICLYPSCFYFFCYAVYEMFIRKNPIPYYGFDDKSHAAVFCSFYGFLSLILLKSGFKYIISLIFVIVSLSTASRLAAIFLPFYVLALMINFFKKNPAKKKNILRSYFKFVGFVSFFSGCFVLAYHYMDKLYIFDRVGSVDAITSANSTSAHMLLIKYGFLLKEENPTNFLLGITPGGFSPVVLRSKVDLSEFAFIDGGAYNVLVAGNAPIHSSHAQVFLEFPIFIFVLYALLLIKILRTLLKRKQWTELLFFTGFVTAVTFYSSMNQLFFFSILFYFIAITNSAPKVSYDEKENLFEQNKKISDKPYLLKRKGA